MFLYLIIYLNIFIFFSHKNDRVSISIVQLRIYFF